MITSFKYFLGAALFCVVVGFMFSGCASVDGRGGEFNKMIISETGFYKEGPTEFGSPDGRMAAGTRVRVLEQASGYMKVQTTSGKEVFVPSEKVGDLSTDHPGGIKW
ncbi:MAG: hypothetical protein SGI71_05420 [Verrucomicrobiota bacterium]|nr:hypothetical protein [Verrucomicrobiota bacterium]